MRQRTCVVDGCEKPTAPKRAEYCGMHYFRLYRNGSLEPKVVQRDSRGTCVVDGCDNTDQGHAGLCAKHATRVRRHGSPDVVLPPVVHSGPTHVQWQGDEVEYGCAHGRVRNQRGGAHTHTCVDCGQQAAHWSYGHSDPSERVSTRPQSYGLAYSTDVMRYEPRCVPCHKAFDQAHS